MKKKPEKIKHPHKPGSLSGEMRQRVNARTAGKSNHTRKSYLRSCSKFDIWRKQNELSNKAVRSDPTGALITWRDALLRSGASPASVHTYIAGAACGLGISMDGIASSPTSATKRKSLGCNDRARKAREKECNREVVGGRRSALQRLTGSDLVLDESGELCIRFLGDKGGKDQLQRIAPEDQAEVRAYFDAVGPDQLLFPCPIDRHLDLHGIRAEHARREYLRYAEICATAEGREEMRRQLWRRYTDPKFGCKAYLLAKAAGDGEKMRALRMRCASQMRDGTYYLHGDNRRVAKQRGLPVAYDRLALLCTSVYSLSHWRIDVALRSYLLGPGEED